MASTGWADDVDQKELLPGPVSDANRPLLMGNYSYVDILIPGKQGVTLALKASSAKTYELEYLTASVAVPFLVKDLGSFSEKRWSLLSRRFFSEGSFSGYFGVAWNSTELSLGDGTISKLSGGVYPDIKLLKIDTLGFNMGLGNRWTVWKGLNLGADWVGWSQPVFIIKKQTPALDMATNDAEKRNVEKVFDAMTYLPRFYFLKCQLGWQF
jgi:hypothetical protein